MDRIQEIQKRSMKSVLYQEEWTENYRSDVKYLLEENRRLKEERDTFQREGIQTLEKLNQAEKKVEDLERTVILIEHRKIKWNIDPQEK